MPPQAHSFHGRRAVSIEDPRLRVTVLQEGGHIAEVLHKPTGVNPLWVPPWRSIEPSNFDASRHRDYGDGSDAKLLAGIMGHNLCLDTFGGPSVEEAAAGMTPHGESSVVGYDMDGGAQEVTMRATLPLAELRIERRLLLHDAGVLVHERVENLAASDRPIAWTQHVTLGPPFLENGVTEFRASATRSKVLEYEFGADDYLVTGAEFDWPHAPARSGGAADLRRYTNSAASCAYTAHLMDPSRENAFFVAFTPQPGLAFGYTWRQRDFPWMGIWEENRSRTFAPWNAATLTRGMEFGVSPMPESRRQMVERGRLFGVPTYRWLPARRAVEVEYWIVLREAQRIPETLEWPA